jgi:hypothetical protein
MQRREGMYKEANCSEATDMNQVETIYKNEHEAPPELQAWLDTHKEELMNYPHHYLLILIPKGIMAIGRTREELLNQIMELSAHPENFSAEDLLQPSFIVNTLVISKQKWGAA